MNLVPVKQTSIPLETNTLYKYHSIKKYPALIIKVAGKLFVDEDEWERMVEAARESQIKEATRVLNPVVIS